MLDIYTADQWADLEPYLDDGHAPIRVQEPITLEEWARRHFYLSAESSYVEQSWTPWPFQRAIMACISNDDVVEVDVKKSARVGYTKILLAAIGYFAEHKRRNQALWQPTDEDADDFMKSEVEPMLRDVRCMREVFPSYLSRHKDNTLSKKRFIGSSLRVRGGKAAKNYRRISVDNAYLDEVDAFDNDIEKEGDPFTLAKKRIEGATFPKIVCGSTPKLKGFSLIDGRFILADERLTFQIACPHCSAFHPIAWGGKDVPHGFKWVDNDPATVRHLCPHCTCLITQTDYIDASEHGRWINGRGDLHLHADGRFTDAHGAQVDTPAHVAFHVWTAYSPNVAWSSIVADFIAAHEKFNEGDDTKKKAWTNTTLGETWEGEVERTEADDLKARAEPFPLRIMPRDCLLLLASADTQDNRLELGVWGYGLGGRMWTIDHRVFFGNPAESKVWAELEEFLRDQVYPHACGIEQRIYASAIDSGGHHTDAVYAFAHKLRALRVHAVRGSPNRERSIENGNARVGYKWNGRIEKNGPILWHVGTNLAKDRFQSRLEVKAPGPGYVHLSRDCSEEWFKQLAGEVRATRRMKWGTETRWAPIRTRIEVRDCLAYTIWLEERLDLWSPRRRAFWESLERSVQPEGDLFASPSPAVTSADTDIADDPDPASRERSPPPLPTKPPARASRETSPRAPVEDSGFGSDAWNRRL